MQAVCLSNVGSSLLAETRRLLRQSGLRVRKGLGQRYLIDEDVLKQIISAAELGPTDIVMEVGPGLGVLTRELARRAGYVVCIELDDKLAALLRKYLSAFNNVTVINQDILEVDPAGVLEGLSSRLPAEASHNYKVVANLPYYITSPVLRLFLEARVKPRMIVVMVQKEVAEAIVAGPGKRSVLSISVQFYGRPVIVGYVPAQSFYPPPEVDSAILRIDLYPHPPVDVSDVKGFFEVVRAGFTAARKQMANSLARGLGLPKNEALSLLEKAGVDPRRRAETLTLEEWAQLWREFQKRWG